MSVIEDVISLLTTTQHNTLNGNNYNDVNNMIDQPLVIEYDEKYNETNSMFSTNDEYENQILWKFMQTKFHLSLSAELSYFKLNAIKLKHIQNLWQRLVQRIDDTMSQYADKCYICLESIHIDTPISLECCGLSIHYNCLKQYIDAKFIRNNGKRVT